MDKRRPQPALMRAVKKLILSGFVVFSFLAYAIHRPLTSSAASPGTTTPTTSVLATRPLPTLTENSPAPTNSQPLASSTPVPSPTTTTSSSPYKDGTYAGPQIDVFYGLVQVQTVIKNGQMVSVQFLEYPNDRRTSVQINSIAIPYLDQEAIQAQSASVDIITGATLTSEGFMMSLQDALNHAKG